MAVRAKNWGSHEKKEFWLKIYKRSCPSFSPADLPYRFYYWSAPTNKWANFLIYIYFFSFSGSLSGRAEHIRPLAAWEETQETLLLSHFLSGSWKCVPLTHTLLTCPGFTASAKGQLCSLGLHWMYFALTLAGACGWWCLFRFLL